MMHEMKTNQRNLIRELPQRKTRKKNDFETY